MPLYYLAGTPGGASGTLQYNNAGVFAGISNSNVSGASVFLDGNLTFNNSASAAVTPSISVTLPTQVASGVAGIPLAITASAARAGASNVGAVAGGDVTITSGAAARLTSGNATGGNINLVTGAGIGSGIAGQVLVPQGAGASPLAIAFTGDTTTGFYRSASGSITFVCALGTELTINSSHEIKTTSNGILGWSSGNAIASMDTAFTRIVAGVASLGTGAAASRAGWLQWAGEARMTADATNLTTTFASLTDLTISNLAAGRKYFGRAVIKCNNSQATEGIKLDFNGGTATMTAFWAVASVSAGGTTVLGTVISTSLAGVVNFTTITGETLIVIDFSFVVNSIAGGTTIILRFAENSNISGTVTAELGSFISLNDSPN